MKPIVRLVGEDGNAYVVLGRCRAAAKKAGWSQEQWKEFQGKATAGDYHQLIATVMENFDIQSVDDDDSYYNRSVRDEDDGE